MENRKERLQATPIRTFACLSVQQSQTDGVNGDAGATGHLVAVLTERQGGGGNGVKKGNFGLQLLHTEKTAGEKI